MSDSQRVKVVSGIFAGATILYAILALSLDRPDLQQACLALVLAVSGGVVAAFAPNLLEAWDRGYLEKGDVLLAGYVIGWGGIFLVLAFQMVFNFLGRPVELRYHPFISMALFLVAVGGALHLAAPGVIELKYPRRYWVRIGIVTTIGLLIAFGMLLFIE